MQTFDATVDFETSDLARELQDAFANMPMMRLRCRWPLTAIVWADGATCEIGELYAADEEQPATGPDDWRVTGDTVQELVDALRAKLSA